MPSFFPKREPVPPSVTAADLQALAAKLDAVTAKLAEHCEVTGRQGEAIARLPAAVLEHVRSEIHDTAGEIASAAWKVAKKTAFEKSIKWGLAAATTAATTYALSWVNTVMAWAHSK